MLLSNLKLEANRANAQHSTGPRTPEGKHRSSLNATRHGLTGQVIVMPEEDLKSYQIHSRNYVQDWQPRGATEQHLIQTLSDHQWRMHRAHAREVAADAIGLDQFGGRISTEDPQIHAVLTSAVVAIEQSKQIERLGRHASPLLRDYNTTLKLVVSLQAARKQREAAELQRAAEIQKLFEMQNIEWNPADDGFVLLKPQIKRHRLREAHTLDANLAARVGFDIRKYFAAGGTDHSRP